MKDPIVEEVRAIRAQIAKECGYDLQRIVKHAAEAAAKIPGLKYVTKEELRTRRRQTAKETPKSPNPT